MRYVGIYFLVRFPHLSTEDLWRLCHIGEYLDEQKLCIVTVFETSRSSEVNSILSLVSFFLRETRGKPHPS